MYGFNIKYSDETEWKNSYDDFGVVMESKSNTTTPTLSYSKLKIPNSNTTIKQDNTYGARVISIKCNVSQKNRFRSQESVDKLIVKLSKPFLLSFDDNRGVFYYAELQKESKITEFRRLKSFNLNIICIDPFGYSVNKSIDSVTWDSDITWDSGVTWDGASETSFDITSNKTIAVNNLGTYKALPIIRLTGSCDNITITCNEITTIYNNLATGEEVEIDCKEYTITKKINSDITNALGNWGGDFIYLESGINSIQISGVGLDVQIEFDFRHTYL